MRRASLIAYLLVLHAAVIGLAWSSHLPERLGLRDAPHIREMRSVLQWRDATTPAGAAIFLGDSLTERLAVSAVEPGAVNFGIGRTRTDQLFIPEAAKRARRIYLLIGTNDFMQGRAEGIEARLAGIAAALPDRPLIWTGIMLPEAHAANRKIQQLCAARPNCAYVPPITDPALFVDGVHLSPNGYAAWIEALHHATP